VSAKSSADPRVALAEFADQRVFEIVSCPSADLEPSQRGVNELPGDRTGVFRRDRL
jgi:hypothetical protein